MENRLAPIVFATALPIFLFYLLFFIRMLEAKFTYADRSIFANFSNFSVVRDAALVATALDLSETLSLLQDHLYAHNFFIGPDMALVIVIFVFHITILIFYILARRKYEDKLFSRARTSATRALLNIYLVIFILITNATTMQFILETAR